MWMTYNLVMCTIFQMCRNGLGIHKFEAAGAGAGALKRKFGVMIESTNSQGKDQRTDTIERATSMFDLSGC